MVFKGPAPIQKAQLDSAANRARPNNSTRWTCRGPLDGGLRDRIGRIRHGPLFGVVSDKRLRSSLAGKSVKDDEHGIVRYGNLSPKFVMPLGRFAAFSRSKKLLTEHRDFLIKLYGAQTGPSLRTHIAGTKKLQRYVRLASTKARSRLGGAERAIEALSSVAEDVDSLLLDITMSFALQTSSGGPRRETTPSAVRCAC